MAIEADQWNESVVEIVFLMTFFSIDRETERQSFSYAK